MESTNNDEENETGFEDLPIISSPGTLNFISMSSTSIWNSPIYNSPIWNSPICNMEVSMSPIWNSPIRNMEVSGVVLNNISSTDTGWMLAMDSFQGSMPTLTNYGSDIAATAGNGSSNFKAAAENALFPSSDEMCIQRSVSEFSLLLAVIEVIFGCISIAANSGPFESTHIEAHYLDKLQSHCRSKHKYGNEVIPEIGMEFETEEEAFNFYKTYASNSGFRIRRSKFHKQNGKIMDRTFCCFREGWRVPDKRDVNVKTHRPETRCGCLAKMKINCRQTAGYKYRVIEFVDSHNHETSSPSKNYLQKPYGNKTLAQAIEVHSMDISRIPPNKTPKLMGEPCHKIFQLFTQLANQAAKSDEKWNFIISGHGNMVEEVVTKFGDKRIDEHTKRRIVGESSRPKSILNRTIKKEKPRHKALPPPSVDSMFDPTVEQGVLLSTSHFVQELYMAVCKPSMDVKGEQNSLPRSLQFTQEHMSDSSPISLYMDEFPTPIKEYIDRIVDVKADGNCGFRAIAGLMDFGEDEWMRVRSDMMIELQNYSELYSKLYGSEDKVIELIRMIEYFDDCPGNDFWMTMPDMGYIIASKYNVVLYQLSNVQCLTFLPLHSMPVLLWDRKEIAIGFVKGNHFIQVFLKSGHPVPPIARNWTKHHLKPLADGWDIAYQEKINQFKKLIGSNVITSEIIELD